MFRKLLGISISILLVLSAVQAEASKGLHAEHLQNGMENKRHQPLKENPQPLLPQRHIHRVNWDKILKLSKQQKVQADAIYKDSTPEIEELRKQIHDAYRKIGDIYKEDDLKIREILDDQQKIKFDRYQYYHTKRGGGKPDGGRPSRKRMTGF